MKSRRFVCMWVILFMLLAGSLAGLACGDDDDDDSDDDTPPADDDTADDDTAADDDEVGGACNDALLNKYAEYCPDYDDPCVAAADEIYLDDNDPLYGTESFLTGELEATQFKFDSPFHIQTIRVHFESGGGEAKIHLYADLLGSVPYTLPWDHHNEPVEYMEPVVVDVEDEGWIEIDVSDLDLMFLPGTKVWVGYEHLSDDGAPVLSQGHLANSNYRSRYYDESWADQSAPFKWGAPSYHYMFHLVGNRFCQREGELYFTDVTASAGVGVAGQHRTGWVDVDNDGDQDMVLTNLSAVADSTVLYRNNGDGTFTDITAGSGLDGGYYATMSLFADYDNDGDKDAFIINPVAWPDVIDDDTADDDIVDDDIVDDDAAEDDDTADDDTVEDPAFSVVLTNDGTGHFSLVESTGLDVYGMLSSASLGDYDNDGLLDLYIGAWLKEYPYYPSDPDYLFHNNGDGTFADASEATGIRDAFESPSYGVTWVDYNDDGEYDIFVSNYGRTDNFLFENKGDGTFVNVAAAANLNKPEGTGAGNTFGADFGDINNDGYFDAFLSEIAHPRYQPGSGPSSINVNAGPPGYEYSLENESLNYNPDEGDVDPSFVDFNNDGRLDLYISSLYSGHYSRLYEQQEDGTFLDITYWAGIEMEDCTGNAWADFDGDGDMDLLAAYRIDGGKVKLFRNDLQNDFDWAEIRLVGATANRDAIGAKVTVTAGDLAVVRYVQGARGHYGAQPQMRLHFGLGLAGAIDQVQVSWPGGDTETWTALEVNRFVVLTQGNPTAAYE